MKQLIFLIFVFSLTNTMDRQALRARYKNDQTHQWLSQAPANQNVCPICTEPKKLITLACHSTHQFCSECIIEWREQQSTCPTCRAEIKDSILCTCLKAAAKPSVLIGILATSASTLKTISEYAHPCTICTGLTATALCAACLGAKLAHACYFKDE